MFGDDMLLLLAGRGYGHAAAAIFEECVVAGGVKVEVLVRVEDAAALCRWLAARLFFAQQAAPGCRAIHTQEANVKGGNQACVKGISLS